MSLNPSVLHQAQALRELVRDRRAEGATFFEALMTEAPKFSHEAGRIAVKGGNKATKPNGRREGIKKAS